MRIRNSLICGDLDNSIFLFHAYLSTGEILCCSILSDGSQSFLSFFALYVLSVANLNLSETEGATIPFIYDGGKD